MQEGRHGHVPRCDHLHHRAGELHTQRPGHRHIPTKETAGYTSRIWLVVLHPRPLIGGEKHSPFQVFLLLAETPSGQSRRGFAQIANEIIAEVEGQRVLARQQPPDTTANGDGSRCSFNVSFIVRMKPDERTDHYVTKKHLLYWSASEKRRMGGGEEREGKTAHVNGVLR